MLNKKALAATAGAQKLYVEDVFSTYLYSGNSSTQSINNGIDLSTEGGMVWLKVRTAAANHFLFDTVRGTTKSINSNTTSAQATSVDSLTAFNTNGFSLGAAAIDVNDSGSTYASWTFRKAEKFFDVVTYTGDGSSSRSISHNLGSTPGCIMIKRTDTTSSWLVYHRSLPVSSGYPDYLNLETTDASSAGGSTLWNATPTSTTFSVGSAAIVNANGGTYVAYLFAHDAGGFGNSGSDNVISCGSFTTDASGNFTAVNLGYEPQWMLLKRSDSSTGGSWVLVDNMRGLGVGSTFQLIPNSSAVEGENTAGFVRLTSTGFSQGSPTQQQANATYIYIAIRRGPMKTPEAGTSVYENIAYTGNAATNRQIGSSVLSDLVLLSNRDATASLWSTYAHYVFDRLRGSGSSLSTSKTSAEVTGWDTYINLDVNNGWDTGTTSSQDYLNNTSSTYVSHNFRRAPGFFDVVCYTGNGTNPRTITHNLGAVPELMIIKRRDGSASWIVYHSAIGNTKYLSLNLFNAAMTASTTFNNTSPTSTVFTISSAINGSGQTHVAYLFSSVTGVSKIGSYTGNGSSQTINCGFTGGARFVMIKRTDDTGDWVVFDSARGIVSGNDPYLELNTADAEVTDKDAVDTDNTGFVVNETTGPNINTNGASYIYLAIA